MLNKCGHFWVLFKNTTVEKSLTYAVCLINHHLKRSICGNNNFQQMQPVQWGIISSTRFAERQMQPNPMLSAIGFETNSWRYVTDRFTSFLKPGMQPWSYVQFTLYWGTDVGLLVGKFTWLPNESGVWKYFYYRFKSVPVYDNRWFENTQDFKSLEGPMLLHELHWPWPRMYAQNSSKFYNVLKNSSFLYISLHFIAFIWIPLHFSTFLFTSLHF